MPNASLHVGDAKNTLRQLPESSVQTCVTSPPYWGLRDYGEDGQLGLEETPQEYVQNLVDVFNEVRRVLRDDGTLWLNLGDSYANKTGSGPQGKKGDRASRTYTADEATAKMGPQLKEKDLSLIPYRVASALQADGWWLRSDIIWKKPNPMPESVTDRPTSAHEHIFLLSPSKQYYYDADAIREDAADSTIEDSRLSEPVERDLNQAENRYGENTSASRRNGGSYFSNDKSRNKRDVWEVTTKPYPDAHFAVYPPDLIEPCVLAGSAEGDTVLDPFVGAGTTGLVALAKGRDFTGIDLSEDYCEMAADRIRSDAPLMNTVQIKEAQPRAA